MYTSFVITGALNSPIFSTRCINFQSLACINLQPLLTKDGRQGIFARTMGSREGSARLCVGSPGRA
jgi:hypothetical protein